MPLEPNGAHVDGDYRYSLWRDGAAGLLEDPGRVLFVCLNPSTADARHDDPTVRKMRGFTARWGYRGFAVVNLFAWRSRHPMDVVVEQNMGSDVVGPDNDQTIEYWASCSELVVAAWGALRVEWWQARAREVVGILGRGRAAIHAIGMTRDGSPRHPLYAPYTAAPVVWRYEPLGELEQLEGRT